MSESREHLSMPQPEARNTERMRAYIQAWDEHDVQATGTYLAEDNPQYSPSEVRSAAEAWFEAFPDLRHEIMELAADGEWVLARIRLTGTHEGTFKGIPATGNEIDIADHVSARFADGQLVELHANADYTRMFQQLGVSIPGETSEPSPETVVRRYFDAVNDRDKAAYKATLARDFQYGSIEGPDEMAKNEWRWVDAMDLHWEIVAMHVADQYVTSRVRARGTHREEILGLDPTNESFDITGITVSRVEDGEITEWWGEWDFAGLLDQIGVLEAPVYGE